MNDYNIRNEKWFQEIIVYAEYIRQYIASNHFVLDLNEDDRIAICELYTQLCKFFKSQYK